MGGNGEKSMSIKETSYRKQSEQEERNMTIKAVIWDNAGVLGNAKCGSFVQLWADRLDVQLERTK